jgi:hypothetical protein
MEHYIINDDIDNVNELIAVLSNYNNNFIYRGMANSKWRLRTSIDRLLENVNRENKNYLLEAKVYPWIEMGFQSHFIKNHQRKYIKITASNDVRIDVNNFLKLQMFLQHYGYPTRMIDFTENWRKALFFCIEDKKEYGDCALFIFNKSKIPHIEKSLLDDNYINNNNPIFADLDDNMTRYYYKLKEGIYYMKNDFFKRIKFQEGVFIIPGVSDYDDIEYQMTKTLSQNDIIKIIIKKELRHDITKYLKKEKITKKYLYPKDINEIRMKVTKHKILKIIKKSYPPISVNLY